MARIGDNLTGIRYPIEFVTRRRLEMRCAKEWAQCFAGLNTTILAKKEESHL